MEILKDLDNIDWANLSHAYGSAVNIPQTIRALLSQDESKWDRALDYLCQSIWHQGTMYSATAYVVPFLVELLELESVINRDGILYFLSMLAPKHAYQDIYYHPVNKVHMLQARENVLKHVNVYKRLLHHNKPEIIGHSAYLLTHFTELSSDLFLRFKELYSKDTRQSVRSSLLHGIRELEVTPEDKSEFFERVFAQENNENIRSIAALGIFEAEGSRERNDVFDYLLNYYQLLERETEYGWWPSRAQHHDPWGPAITTSLISEACLTWSSIFNLHEAARLTSIMNRPFNVFNFIQKLCFQLFSNDLTGQENYTSTMKNGIYIVHFYKGKLIDNNLVSLKENPSVLPNNFALAIELILQLDKFWEVDSNLLNLFGLPHSRLELQELYSRSQTTNESV